MAYNSSKGPRNFGDINYEGDPSETQIDFDNDFIALRTNGVQRFAISGSKVEITGALLRDADNAYDIGSVSSPWSTVYAIASVHPAAGTYSTMSTTGSITSGSAGSTRIGPGYITHSGSSYHTVSTSGSMSSGSLGSISSSLSETTWHGYEPLKTTTVTGYHVSSSGPVSGSELFGLGTGLKFPIRTESSHYTASLTDYTILVDTTSANVGVMLPSASLGDSKIYNVKKINAFNTVIVNTAAGTIDGDATRSLTSNYESLTFHSDGTNWHII